MIKKLNTAEVFILQLVLLCRDKNKVCLFGINLSHRNALGMVRDCQHGIYTTGGVSRVDEMILARERSGFAGKKVWDDIPVVAAASDAHVDVFPGANVSHSPPHPTSDVPTTEVPTDVHLSSVPAAETIPANSGTTPETPSSPVRDARKGKGVAVEEPTPTYDKTFKQLEEERLGWEAAQRLQAQELADFEKQRAESLMKDANLARQMSHDFEMTEDQRKRQQEVLASAANYSDAAWDIILARLQANPDLSSIIFGVEFTDDDFAARMVELVNTRRKELAEQRAQERRERPMTPSQLRQYMTILGCDKIQRAVAFTRGLIRDGILMSSASSKKLKTGDDEANVEAPSHGVPQEEETTIEDVDASSNLASTAQHTASSLKKVGTKKKRLGRKGVHTSQSTIQISEGDLEAAYKVCIKYASDADSAYDDDTHKYPLSVNLIERMLDHQLEICHGSVGNELTTAVQLIAFLKKQISNSKRPKVHDCPRVNGYLVKASSNPLLFFDSPLPGVNTPWDVMRIVCNPDLMDIMLLQWFFDAASSMLLVRRILKLPHCCCWFKVSPSASIGFVFLLLLSLNPQAHKYVVPTGRVKVPAGRYVVPTGKDNVIVSGYAETKVILAGCRYCPVVYASPG
ncbi:hypothetical protein Tco_0706183 [Tanacetum coccineum]|uniref:Uncharacterized protein n=1 Tax=Tanacetum coccineum TaxID=301880 RepID=A0ABQ4Y874_9ASTR